MNETIAELMDQLHLGIDVTNNTVNGLHKMDEKFHHLSAITHLLMEEGEFVDFLFDVGEVISDMLEELRMDEAGELHLIAEEEAAEKLGVNWTLKHRARIKKLVLEETEHERRIITIIHNSMVKINSLFEENKEEFHEDPEIHALCQKFHVLFTFYLNLFQKELKRLETN